MQHVKIGNLYRRKECKDIIFLILNIELETPDSLSFGYRITYLTESKIKQVGNMFEDTFFSLCEEV
jgi:hypothetical protein